MCKQINVLNAEEFKGTGILFYCVSDEMQAVGSDDAKEWFGSPNKLILNESGVEFGIESVAPMISFTGAVAFMIKVKTNKVPAVRFPTVAAVSYE